MKIALIAAVAENGVIGKDNQLLWHLPADLQHFKRLTTGHVVMMGRKTYESIRAANRGKPLPNRTNVIVTRQPDYRADGCEVVHSLDEAFNHPALRTAHAALFVIGGAELYAQVLPLADKLYLTEVKTAPDGDALFPTINLTDWDEITRTPHPADERHAHAFEFVELERSGL